MERYIIPFNFRDRSYYVFIDKDDRKRVYLVGKILPQTDESYSREISFQSIAEVDRLQLHADSFDSAICNTLYKFLEARGWLAFAN